VILSIPTAADLEREVDRYVNLKPVEYLTPPQLLRNLISDINRVALPYIDYLDSRCETTLSDLEAAIDRFLANDRQGKQALEDFERTRAVVKQLEPEVHALRLRIDAHSRDSVELIDLGKRLKLKIAELDLVERQMSRYGPIFENSIARLKAVMPTLKGLGDQLDLARNQFLKGLRWLILLRGMSAAALIAPAAFAFLITFTLDRISQFLDKTMLDWLRGSYHDVGLLALFAAQTVCLTPVTSALIETFCDRKFDQLVARFHALAKELGDIDNQLGAASLRIEKLAAGR